MKTYKTERGLAFPTVHLNGTSKDELERQLREAVEATRDALCKLDDAAPNPRDYYTQAEANAHTLAVNQHLSRRERLNTVAQELESIWEGVNDQ